MMRSFLAVSVLLAAPTAWAQNRVPAGQWARDLGARGPQPTDGLHASGIINSSAAACGPETWSTDRMAYASSPCGTTGAAANQDVGFSGPVAPMNQPNATPSTSMLHQEMKQWETARPRPAPQAVLAETPMALCAQ